MGIACLPTPAFAQLNLTPDDSLGTIVEAPDLQTDIVTGGVRSLNGANLFHSFQEFNVQEGRSVYFNSPIGVENILSRVTGSDPSDILGTLGTRGNANLFLLNPNGIIFGPNSSLDVRGSFVATTANAIQFGQGFFSASNSETPPLLTINPSALLFNQIPAGSIINRSNAPAGSSPSGDEVSGLRAADGQRLSLIGGNVSLDSGRLLAYGGRVTIGGLASAGVVSLNPDGSLGFPEGIATDVVLTNASQIDVAAGNGGEIAIYAGNLDILQGSTLRAGIRLGLGDSNSQAGSITLDVTGAIQLDNNSAIRNRVEENATGQSGDIRITTAILSLTSGARLTAGTYGQGNAGDIIIDAGNRISFDNAAANNVVFGRRAIGQGGDIRITTGALSLTNGAALTASTFAGQGDVGDVIIDASDHVSFDNSDVNTLVVGGSGQGGDIRITTGSLSLTSGAQLGASTLGQGNAGNVIIDARHSVSFDGIGSRLAGEISNSGALSSVGETGVGRGGDIRITTGSLSLTNGAQLASGTQGQGDAGNIIIAARDRVSFDGVSPDGIYPSAAASSVDRTGRGDGKDIDITTDSLSITNGAAVIANTFGQGNAGNVRIDARDVFLDGVGTNGESSVLDAFTDSGAQGQGGGIVINTDSLRIANGAVVTAQTFNIYPGGSIIINAKTLTATTGGQLITTTRSSGRAGNITLNVTDRVNLSGRDPTYADRLTRFDRDVVANESAVSGVFANTTSGPAAQGGNIGIAAEQLIVEDGAITVSSPQGQAGNLTIVANTVLLNQGSLTAQTGASFGEAGANINLQNLGLLVLQNGSRISAEANSTADGGNITINAANGFVIATPDQDNDILASADFGNGGRIDIFTQGIFGIEEREATSGDETNDINASSQAGVPGTVTINRLDIDPSTGLAELPSIPVATELTQGCQSSGGQSRAEFFNTGRGGLPPTPYQPLSSSDILDDMRLPRQETVSVGADSPAPIASSPARIVEAQGWMIKENGEVALVAQIPAAEFQGWCRLR